MRPGTGTAATITYLAACHLNVYIAIENVTTRCIFRFKSDYML